MNHVYLIRKSSKCVLLVCLQEQGWETLKDVTITGLTINQDTIPDGKYYHFNFLLSLKPCSITAI